MAMLAWPEFAFCPVGFRGLAGTLPMPVFLLSSLYTMALPQSGFDWPLTGYTGIAQVAFSSIGLQESSGREAIIALFRFTSSWSSAICFRIAANSSALMAEAGALGALAGAGAEASAVARWSRGLS